VAVVPPKLPHKPCLFLKKFIFIYSVVPPPLGVLPQQTAKERWVPKRERWVPKRDER
jgi:hypothetical protein